MKRLAELWRWLSTSRYTRYLEAENARLRRENYALAQTAFVVRGVPAEFYREFAMSEGATQEAGGASPAPTTPPGVIGSQGKQTRPRRVTWARMRTRLERESYKKAAEQRNAANQ